MAEVHAEDMKPSDAAAEEIMKRLEERKNYIPGSEQARREYAYALLREYRKYIRERSSSDR